MSELHFEATLPGKSHEDACLKEVKQLKHALPVYLSAPNASGERK